MGLLHVRIQMDWRGDNGRAASKVGRSGPQIRGKKGVDRRDPSRAARSWRRQKTCQRKKRFRAPIKDVEKQGGNNSGEKAILVGGVPMITGAKGMKFGLRPEKFKGPEESIQRPGSKNQNQIGGGYLPTKRKICNLEKRGESRRNCYSVLQSTRTNLRKKKKSDQNAGFRCRLLEF